MLFPQTVVYVLFYSVIVVAGQIHNNALSKTTILDLPNHLMREIISNFTLPQMSAFRGVNKDWRDIADDTIYSAHFKHMKIIASSCDEGHFTDQIFQNLFNWTERGLFPREYRASNTECWRAISDACPLFHAASEESRLQFDLHDYRFDASAESKRRRKDLLAILRLVPNCRLAFRGISADGFVPNFSSLLVEANVTIQNVISLRIVGRRRVTNIGSISGDLAAFTGLRELSLSNIQILEHNVPLLTTALHGMQYMRKLGFSCKLGDISLQTTFTRIGLTCHRGQKRRTVRCEFIRPEQRMVEKCTR